MEFMTVPEKKRVVIIGGGFAGVYVACELVPFVEKGVIDITIINRTNYFLFTPLLHEVATGGLSPVSVTEPLREIFSANNVNIVEGAVSSINTSSKKISLNHTEVFYDYLVIATGSEVNYANIHGASSFALPLGNLEDALRIRSRTIDEFRIADESSRSEISFAIVGGGATGVEIAAELNEFVSQIQKKYYPNIRANITLISTSQEILRRFSEGTRLIARKRLLNRGIRIECGNAVKEVSSDGIMYEDGTKLPAQVVIWAAGVRPTLPTFLGKELVYEDGRISVDIYFRCLGVNDVFALGDVAGFRNSGEKDFLPMLAQVAVGASGVVAKNIVSSIEERELTSFSFKTKGMLISLGRWYAAGNIFMFEIKGIFAWWMWRTIYLFKFFSWRKRIKIALEWTLHIFSSRDITRI